MSDHDRRLTKAEETLQVGPYRDITFVIRKIKSVRHPDESVREIEVPCAESDYETSDWQHMESGDRMRIRKPRDLGPEFDA